MRQIDLQRTVVVGTTGAGKTTFARRLARSLGASHIELDALYWEPNWAPRAPAQFRALVTDAIVPERWVLDGNYSAVRDLVWMRATSVIWLDYTFPRVVWQVVRRTVARARSGEALFGGNRESLRAAFLSRDSIVLWAVTTFHRRRRQYRALFEGPAFPHLRTFHFRHPGAAAEFLRSIEASLSPSTSPSRDDR